MSPSPKKFSAPASWSGVTTVMFRNIPSRYTQQSLLVELRAEGFQPDYFYLPMDFKKNANAGYAFLNFGDEKEVAAFRGRFDGARLAIRSAKLLQVVPAALQGYEANQAHMQHSAVMNHHRAEHGPLFMRESGNAAVSAEEGLYVVRDLPQMYTHELVALELLNHGCGMGVAFLDVPLDAQSGLNQGYALVRFADTQATQHAVRALQGASFSLAPAALPMTITPVELPAAEQAPRVFSYSTPEVEAFAEEEFVPRELEQMLLELVQMQQRVSEPLPRGRFAGLDIAVEDVRVPLSKWQCATPPTVSTACSDSSPRIAETPLRCSTRKAVTPPTRSTSASSAGSSPRLAALEAPDAPFAPFAAFALPCLLPSPASCRAIAQGC